MRLTDLSQPFILAVVTDRSVEEARVTLREAALQGAHAAELNLPLLADASDLALRELIERSPLPVCVSCSRTSLMPAFGIQPNELPLWTDVERMERQLEAVRYGACAIDLEMDTFDPHPAPVLGSAAARCFAQQTGPPAELSDDPRAVVRQMEIIDRAHDAGAEVMLTCHTGRRQSRAQLLTIGQKALDRGGDLLTIVSPCRDRADLQALLQATSYLSSVMPIPFVLIGSGPAGLISRTLGVRFGAGWFFAKTEHKPFGNPDQPLMSEIASARRYLPQRVEA